VRHEQRFCHPAGPQLIRDPHACYNSTMAAIHGALEPVATAATEGTNE
jgi:hypothetical protein